MNSSIDCAFLPVNIETMPSAIDRNGEVRVIYLVTPSLPLLSIVNAIEGNREFRKWRKVTLPKTEDVVYVPAPMDYVSKRRMV